MKTPDAVAGAAPGRSLKRRAIEGSAISLVAYSAAQVLRIVAHAIVAQELLPGVFGVMAIINTVVVGVQMFADIGIGPSIIQSKRGDDPGFLRTAWTIQVVRGAVLWGVVAILAFPLSHAYAHRGLVYLDLVWLLPVAGASAFISGFGSTSLFTLNRKLLLARLASLDLASQVIGLATTIVWVKIDPSVWAFVAGGLVGSATRTIASHLWLPGIAHRLFWDRSAAAELVRFGRWIFLSTAIGFMGDRGYTLILGAMMLNERLGLMSAATMLAGAVDDALSRVWQSVLFPTYARLKDRGLDHLRRRVAQVRLWLMAATFPPLLVLAFFGRDIARLLYLGKPEFMDVGVLLVVLAAGKLTTARTSAFPILLAVGDSLRFMVVKGATTGAMLLGMGLGGAIWGEAGLVYGLAFGPSLAYPFHVWALRAHRMNMPLLDSLGYLIGGSGAFASLWLLGEGRVW